MRASLLRSASSMVFFSLLVLGCTQARGVPPLLQSTKSANGNALSVDEIKDFYFTQNDVRNLSAFRVPDTTILVSLWEERNSEKQWVPFYAASLNGRDIAVARQTSYDLLLHYAQFDPLSAQASGLTARAEPLTDVRIVQLNTQVLPGYREQLEAAGARVYRFLPNNALIVRAPPYVASQISAQPNVRWMGAYRAEYRLEEQLLAQLAVGNGNLEPARYHIEVFERGPYQQAVVEERIAQIGGRVEIMLPQGFFMDATLDGQQLVEVARMDEVAFIDRWSPPEMDDVQVRTIGGADYLETQTGFTGQGVRAEVLDLGVLATHQEFQGTLIPHGQQNIAAHGTSTTGINFAKGIDPRARGLVPDAQGITASMSFLTDRYQHTAELVQDPYFAVYQSNSWGDSLTTQYTTVSAQMDDIIFLDDFLITQSQSNAGTQQSRPQAWAKNIVSVGGLQHRGSLDMNTHCWCHSGSIGPAADGRIKPDLAHFYDGVYAPSGGPTSYDTGFGGTSAATPIVAGHFGLFFQMWHNGIFGNPTAATVFDSRPHATTAKAFLINTARQWSFSGTADDRTRTHQGWGLPDLQNLYDSRNRIFFVDETDLLQPFQSTSYQLEVLDGTPALKATMVYKDPMGTTSSTLHRINDLDLQVTSPSGVVYWGNNGLREAMWSSPGGSPDNLDTVENVFVQNPEPGFWTVQVTATEINQDSHPATLELDADYALVVSGVSVPTATQAPAKTQR